LGQPWQFDLDATHDGRSNNYSFMHKGVNHVLKPIPESAIKAEVFATSKVKKKVAEITPKPRTALIHEGRNDVTIPAKIITASIVAVPVNNRKGNANISPSSMASNDTSHHFKISIDNSLKSTGGSYDDGVITAKDENRTEIC
jgi:hypothetical protein